MEKIRSFDVESFVSNASEGSLSGGIETRRRFHRGSLRRIIVKIGRDASDDDVVYSGILLLQRQEG